MISQPPPAPSSLHSNSKPLRIFGIDPGTRLCGYAIIERSGNRLIHIDNGVIVLDESKPLSERLAVLWHRIVELFHTFKPQAVAVEGVFTGRNIRSALTLAHARGVALATAAIEGLPVHEYTPQQIKQAVTGTGRADKEQIQKLVTLRMGLPEPPQADAADALAAAMCHGQHCVEAPSPLPTPQKGAKHRSKLQLLALVRAQMAAKGEL